MRCFLARPIGILCSSWPFLLACQDHHVGRQGSARTTTGSLDGLPLQEVLDSLGIPADSIRFEVDKSDRRFFVLAGDRAVRDYPCVLGTVPDGDKMQEGDRRTPEGSFLFRDKYPHAKWHKFIWIDYPNAESRERFQRRKEEGLLPASAAIGGEVGIHGTPKGMDHWIMEGTDWTWGCIALRNADLDEVYPFIRPRWTRLDIRP